MRSACWVKLSSSPLKTHATAETYSSTLGSRTPLTSYFEHNERSKLDKVLAALDKGDVALISDAGMPAVNDPGYLLVRAALDSGHQVSPVPGPSAPISALAASGLPSDQFLYLGYAPRKAAERRRAFAEVADLPYTLILLEAPHRLLPTLQDLQAILGERQVAVAAELTKLYERFFRGLFSEAIAFYEAEVVRGEFTIVVAGAQAEAEAWDDARVLAALKDAKGGETPSQLARRVAASAGWPRSQVYELLQKMSQN